jgi:hypothetical protein
MRLCVWGGGRGGKGGQLVGHVIQVRGRGERGGGAQGPCTLLVKWTGASQTTAGGGVACVAMAAALAGTVATLATMG